MKNRIVINKRSGSTVYGNWYEVDFSSPCLFGYPPYNTEQEFSELDKAINKNDLILSDISSWHVQYTNIIKEKNI